MKSRAIASCPPTLTALCCDLVGSTAKQQPGSGLGPDSVSRAEAFALAHRQLEERVRRELARFGGDDIHPSADNLSASFDNPEHAVVCALALQQSLHSDPISLPRGRVEIRIGVHTGTTFRDDTTYLGDPGNVAARLHAYARPGGVVVSARTKEECSDLEGLEWGRPQRRKPKGLARFITLSEVRCPPEALLRLVPRMIERTGEQRRVRRDLSQPPRTGLKSKTGEITVNIREVKGQSIGKQVIKGNPTFNF